MNNLLLNRLNKLDKDTFQRFVLFVKSPYFHKSEKAIQVIEHIKPYYPDFTISKAIKNKISKVVPSQVSHDVLFSRINDLLDEFELYELFNRKKFLKDSLKYELELDAKNNIKYYNQLETKKLLPQQSGDEFYADFYKEFGSISICENNWISNKEKIIYHSERAMIHISHFFLSKYLMVYANEITHTLNMQEKPVASPETEILLNYVTERIDRLPVSVQCIFYIIRLFKNISTDNEEFDLYYKKLKEQTFHLNREEISYEIKYALIQASSACVFKCYSNPEYFHNAFEIIRFLVEKDLYFTDLHEQMIQQRFILIVKIALGAGEVEWARTFIDDKIKMVSKASRDDLYNYALGLIYFNQHQYNEAVKRMLKINLNTPQFTVDYKMTLLKMYYELDEPAGFNYQSQTFLKFLGKEKTLNKTHKKNVVDSVELIKWLLKYKKNKKQEELKEKVRIKKLDYLISGYRDKWFKEKFSSLTS